MLWLLYLCRVGTDHCIWATMEDVRSVPQQQWCGGPKLVHNDYFLAMEVLPERDMALVCVWKIEGNPLWHPLLFSKWNCEDKKCVNLSRPLFRLPLRSCTHSLQYLFWFEDKETWEIRRLGALTSYSVPCPRKRRCPKGYILDPAIVFWWSEWATGTKWGRL